MTYQTRFPVNALSGSNTGGSTRSIFTIKSTTNRWDDRFSLGWTRAEQTFIQSQRPSHRLALWVISNANERASPSQQRICAWKKRRRSAETPSGTHDERSSIRRSWRFARPSLDAQARGRGYARTRPRGRSRGGGRDRSAAKGSSCSSALDILSCRSAASERVHRTDEPHRVAPRAGTTACTRVTLVG